MEAFVKFNLDQEYTIKVIFGAKLDKNLIPKAFQKYIEHPSDAEAQEDLATAKYLLSGESLPKYFVCKEGQNVIRFFDEFHKEENNRLELAQNKLSWLINSTFVFTEDAKSAEYLSNNPYFIELQGKVEQFSEDVIRSKEEIMDHILNRKIEDVKSDKEHILIFVSAWKDEELEENSKILADKLNVLGDVNFEYILDKNGTYHFVECNPRFSAGCEFSCMAGYDYVENHMKCFMNKEIEDCHFKHNMIIARKYEEYITATDIDVEYGNTCH